MRPKQAQVWTWRRRITLLEGVSYPQQCTCHTPLNIIPITTYMSLTLRRQLVWTTVNVVFVTMVSFLSPKSILLVTFSGLWRSDPRACNIWSPGRCRSLCTPQKNISGYLPAGLLASGMSKQTISYFWGMLFNENVSTTEIRYSKAIKT
jgi:hypothetical protein